MDVVAAGVEDTEEVITLVEKELEPLSLDCLLLTAPSTPPTAAECTKGSISGLEGLEKKEKKRRKTIMFIYASLTKCNKKVLMMITAYNKLKNYENALKYQMSKLICSKGTSPK